jgi:hypothetical protein
MTKALANFMEQSYLFVLGKPFQPSLMFVDKSGAYPSEAPFRCCTLEKAPVLIQKH